MLSSCWSHHSARRSLTALRHLASSDTIPPDPPASKCVPRGASCCPGSAVGRPKGALDGAATAVACSKRLGGPRKGPAGGSRCKGLPVRDVPGPCGGLVLVPLDVPP